MLEARRRGGTTEQARVAAPPEGLWGALEALDRLLASAVALADDAYGDRSGDGFRGLYIRPEDVRRLLDLSPGSPTFGAPGASLADDSFPALTRLAEQLGLSAFDRAVVVVALACEIDLRYERVYAYLQDDVTRRRPSVDLALSLLCSSAQERVAARARFAADAPLLAGKVLHLAPDPTGRSPLAAALTLDEQVTRLLLGAGGLDSRLTPFCRLSEVEGLEAAQPEAEGPDLRAYLRSGDPAAVRAVAEELAARAGQALLVADLARAPVGATDDVLPILFREARLFDRVLLVEGVDALARDGSERPLRALVEALDRHPGSCLLSGTNGWAPVHGAIAGVTEIRLPEPSHAERRELWGRSLRARGMDVEETDLDALAARFLLTPTQIEDAAEAARSRVASRAIRPAPAAPARNGGSASGAPCDEEGARPSACELFAEARAQTGHELARLARKIEPAHAWEDIVLPEEALAQLRELCGRVVHRERVLEDWGFAGKLAGARGVTALFAGPSGTGKTMAAEILAGKLGLDLYKINLAGVVDKYIGETEKNLDRIFTAAERVNGVLFFDEADALFGKRSEVRDSHDRYANIEIAFLLQRMEAFAGVAVLATNLRRNLDEAFTRRLDAVVNFPFPEEDDRLRIWTRIWPESLPLAEDVDLPLLASRFKLSGGHIRNAALAAAFLAADDGGKVTTAHLLEAVRREYHKLGKALEPADLEAARA